MKILKFIWESFVVGVCIMPSVIMMLIILDAIKGTKSVENLIIFYEAQVACMIIIGMSVHLGMWIYKKAANND